MTALWSAARTLGRRAPVANPLPPLFFFTDPRVAEPETVAERLPGGAGVVYRTFGAADARERGRRLAAIARARGLTLLVGEDAALAAAIGADGLHLPERRLGDAAAVRARRPRWVLTAAAHGPSALREIERLRLHAAFVSPVFASESPSAGAPIGPRQLARWIEGLRTPVYALGGVSVRTVGELRHTGAAGIAAVSAFVA